MEAVRLAVGHMTPVILLSDGYLASAAEPWLVPDLSAIPVGHVQYAQPTDGFHPFQRDPKSLARVWPIPGTPGVEHRIGGLEKSYASGNISYDPDNHAKMTRTRADKVARVADDIPLQGIDVGQEKGHLLVVGWGSTYGPIRRAVLQSREDEGLDVSFTHLRYLNPFPRNLGDLLRGFDRILVPEQNTGQLTAILRSTYLVDAQVLSKVTGKPFMVSEIRNAISVALKGGEPS